MTGGLTLKAKKLCIDTIINMQSPEGFFITNNGCYIRECSYAAYALYLWGHGDKSLKFFDWAFDILNNYRFHIQLILDKKEMNSPVRPDGFLPCKFDSLGEIDELSHPQIDGWATFLWAVSQYCYENNVDKIIRENISIVSLLARYLAKYWNHHFLNCWEENEEQIHLSNVIAIYGGLKSVNAIIDSCEINDTLVDIKKYITDSEIVRSGGSKLLRAVTEDAILVTAIYPYRVFDCSNKEGAIIDSLMGKSGNMGIKRYAEDKYYGGGFWPILNCFFSLSYLKIREYSKALEHHNYVTNIIESSGYPPKLVIDNLKDEECQKWIGSWGYPKEPCLWTAALYLILDWTINKV